MDNDSPGAGAPLTRRREGRSGAFDGGQSDVRVLVDDRGIVAPELESDDSPRRIKILFQYRSTNRPLTCEEDAVHALSLIHI